MQSNKQYEWSSWSIGRLIHEVIRDRDTLDNWLISQNLLPEKRKCHENHEMRLCKRSHMKYFQSFRCRVKHADKKDVEVSQAKGTLFEKSQLPPEKTMMLCLLFANGYIYSTALKEMNFFRIVTSNTTVSEFFSYCREIISQWMLNHENSVIGGPGVTVEVEEAKFEIPKNINSESSGLCGEWIVGFVERGTNRFCLEKYTDEMPDDITSFIQRHVRPQTIITSDSCSVRNVIESCRNYFFKENDKNNFVYEPRTMLESIDSWWCSQKRKHSSSNKYMSGERYMEYLFRRKMAYENTDCFDKLLELFRLNHPYESVTDVTNS